MYANSLNIFFSKLTNWERKGNFNANREPIQYTYHPSYRDIPVKVQFHSA